MALILAVNPGGTQSGTLARLARELPGHELIGADSCAVAIAALDDHKPALVLLPAAAPTGEAELLIRLRTAAKGGIPTLKLPQPTSVDPRALADQIRQLLQEPASAPPMEAPAATTPSTHLIAAATAAIEWVRARRETWPVAATAPAQFAFEGGASTPARPEVFRQAPEPELEPEREREPAGPSAVSRAASALLEKRESILAWLPHAAALAAAAGLVWAVIAFWPQLQGSVTGARPAGSVVERPSSAPTASGGTPARGGASGAAAAGSPESRLSGWIAVFSPFDVRVSEGTRVIALDDRSRAMLPPGSHTLLFQNRALGYEETRSVQIKSTETTTLNLIPQSRIGVTSTEPAEVLIDGAAVGSTPITARRIDLGTHTVVARSASGERTITVTATSKPVQVDVDFSKP